jgi:MoaA/NifB/PqqE/SkfB family radical SAM enzyme
MSASTPALDRPRPATGRRVRRDETIFSARRLLEIAGGRVPGQVVIQLTDSCNARCPQCEMRVDNGYARASLQEAEIRKVLEAAAEHHVAAVSFTGGEPFLQLEELLRLMRYATDLGIPFVRTGTNAYFLRHADRPGWEEKVESFAAALAATGVRNFWISIDSADPQVHESMRGLPGVTEGIARALPILKRHGIWATANLGVNRATGGQRLALPLNPSPEQQARFHRQCRDAFRSFYRHVLDLGFTIVNFCYPMSIESEPASGLQAIYRASSADDVVRFRRDEKAILFSAMGDAVADFRHRIRIFSPRSMLHALAEHYAGGGGAPQFGCRGGLDFFFVSAADGDTYPCGFRSDENLGRYWDLDRRAPATGEPCSRCDWECFRDPSNLLGPFLELPRRPIALLRQQRRAPDWSRLWWEDLRYQRAADYCDGRRPPDLERLRRFVPRLGAEPSRAAISSTTPVSSTNPIPSINQGS